MCNTMLQQNVPKPVSCLSLSAQVEPAEKPWRRSSSDIVSYEVRLPPKTGLSKLLDRLVQQMLNLETCFVVVLMLTALAFASNRGNHERPRPDEEFPHASQMTSYYMSTHALADQVLDLTRELENARIRGQKMEEKEEAIEKQLEQQQEAMYDVEANEEKLRNMLEEQKKVTERVREELLERAMEMESNNTAREGCTRGGAAKRVEDAVAGNLKSQAQEMANVVRRMSMEEAILRFGEKPRRVRFDLKFPFGTASYPEVEEFASFTVEMAPLHLVPHAINMFLSQVEAKLWDGCLFRQSPRWGLLGEPWNPTERTGREQKFRDLNLHHLSFAEYSADFPHAQYTLAFYGAEGGAKGPSIYVNSRDNFDLWEDIDEIDSCFAKIVEGEEVMMRAWHGEKREGNNILKDPITIEKATLLPLGQ